MRYPFASTSLPKRVSPTDGCSAVPSPRFVPWEIAFDIDGVVADTMAVFVEMVREKLGIADFSKEHLTEYDLHRCLPSVAREALDEILWLTLSDEYTLRVPPCPGAPEFLAKLSRYAPLRFVTARVWPESITRWLYQVVPEVPREAITVVATGDPTAKSDVLREMGVRVFVEDRWDTCERLREEGFEVVVYDQPWNRRGDNFLRVSDWREMDNLVRWPSRR